MEVPRSYIRNYADAIEDAVVGPITSELVATLEAVDYARPIAEIRDEVIRVMNAYCGSAAELSARVSADYYDGLRERMVGRPLGAYVESGRNPEATDGAVRAFVQKLVDGEPPKTFIDLCADRLRYEAKRAAGTCIEYNARRDELRPRYARVPAGGETCDFCIMLASRGPVYRSAESAGMLDHWHANCRCSVVPMWNTYYVGPSRRASMSMTIEGYDPDALYDQYLEMMVDDDTFASRMAQAAERAKARHPDSGGGGNGRPSAKQREWILAEARRDGNAMFHDLYEMGEAIKRASTYDELVELVKQLNRELPFHFPTKAALDVLKGKLRARRKELIT